MNSNASVRAHAENRPRVVRICSYRRADGAVRAGVVEGDVVRDAGLVPWAPEPGAEVGLLADVRLLAPVPRPGKVVCVGRNYAEHAAETGSSVPTQPQLFAKWANAVIAPGDAVRLPPITQALDYEAELVVVIGSTARRRTTDDALDCVLGYTCGNDISARDLQFGDTQWTRGKTLDTFAPMGPWIVTADEIPDPQALGIRALVNGEVRQDDTTAHMVFPVRELLAFITEAITLEPGDVVYTGTPPGVGHGMTPPTYLRPGDVTRVEIDGIGALENPIVAA
jgi:2-keto-4-pentenoate hydratase/2-oxohepta-3-ene-1,7-dioic acid hydratase in catechol pathway